MKMINLYPSSKHHKMIRIFLALLLVFPIYRANAQSSFIGYYITQKNDTVKAQIKVKKGMLGQISNDFNEEVEVIDSVKGVIKFLPEDIKGYGFSSNRYKYVFVSKPVKSGAKKFLSPLYIGAKSSLYLYGIQSTGGAIPSKQVFYTFEKSDNVYLFLRNILNDKFRSQLREFYKDIPVAQQFIDTNFRYWLNLDKDLIELLQKVNIE